MSQLDNGVQILTPIFRTQNVTQIEVTHWLTDDCKGQMSSMEVKVRVSESESGSTTQTIKESHRGGNKYTLHDTPATQINHFVFVILRPPYILAKASN